MQKYLSDHRVDSKLFPGVAYVIKAPSFGRRLELDKATAEFRAQTRTLQKRHEKLVTTLRELEVAYKRDQAKLVAAAEESLEAAKVASLEPGETQEQHDERLLKMEQDVAVLKAGGFRIPPDLRDELQTINEESIRLMGTQFNTPRLKIYLKGIDGFEIDGQPATRDNVITDGPPEMFHEILDAIDQVEGLKAEEIKNLSSPSTSSSPAAGETNATTATSAGVPPDSTKPATA